MYHLYSFACTLVFVVLIAWYQAQMARARLQLLCQRKKIQDGDECTALSKAEYSSFEMMDPMWQIDAAIIAQLIGDGAEPRALKHILALLQTQEKYISPSQALQNLEQLQAAPSHKMTPAAAHGSTEYVATLLSQLANETAVDLGIASSTGFTRQVFTTFTWFARWGDNG